MFPSYDWTVCLTLFYELELVLSLVKVFVFLVYFNNFFTIWDFVNFPSSDSFMLLDEIIFPFY